MSQTPTTATNDQIARTGYAVEHVAEDTGAIRALLGTLCRTIEGLPQEAQDGARRAIFAADAALADLDEQMSVARRRVQG